MQRYTSAADVVDGEKLTFPECGGTSVGAVLMSEDLRHAFNVHCGISGENEADRLPLLLDKILHCPLSDVIQYISSQLSSFANTCTVSAAARDDENSLAVKTMSEDVVTKTQHKISALIQTNTSSTVSSTDLPSNAACHPCDTNLVRNDGKSCSESFCAASAPPVKRRRTISLNSSNLTDVDLAYTTAAATAAANDDDDDAKPKHTDISCDCQAMLSASVGRSSCLVFCKDCCQGTTALAYDSSKSPQFRTGIITTVSFRVYFSSFRKWVLLPDALERRVVLPLMLTKMDSFQNVYLNIQHIFSHFTCLLVTI